MRWCIIHLHRIKHIINWISLAFTTTMLLVSAYWISQSKCLCNYSHSSWITRKIVGKNVIRTVSFSMDKLSITISSQVATWRSRSQPILWPFTRFARAFLSLFDIICVHDFQSTFYKRHKMPTALNWILYKYFLIDDHKI